MDLQTTGGWSGVKWKLLKPLVWATFRDHMISVHMRMSQVGWHECSCYVSIHIHEQDGTGVPGTLGADVGLQILLFVCLSHVVIGPMVIFLSAGTPLAWPD